MKNQKVIVLNSKLIFNNQISSHAFLIRTTKGSFSFRSGQYVSLGIAGNSINREYSIFSGEEEPYLDFLIRKVKGGIFSNLLANLVPGDTIQINGPFGGFGLKQKSGKHFFIASGTGIAPFHSMIVSNPNLDFKLLHGIREEDETYGVQDYSHAEYIPCFSRKDNRVTRQLKDLYLSKDSFYYLCGNQKMIFEASEILIQKDIPIENILTEVFF